MQNGFITIELGDIALLEQYRDVFLNSTLFDHYYAEDDRLRVHLMRALRDKELLVGKSGDEIVSVMEVRMTGFFGGFPYLALLGVKKGWRGMGIGHQMLAFFEEMARQAGFERTSIMASGFNPRARKLYQSLGYRRIGFLEDAFKPGISEYIYVKTL